MNNHNINISKPLFITFEGGEGSGKSTQSKLLYEYLLSENIPTIYTREIGGTLEAEKIRDLMLHTELLPTSELMLVMAARYEHINKVIAPSLLAGKWVICDRFVDSTACYQTNNNSIKNIKNIYSLHQELMTYTFDKNDISNQSVNHRFTKKAILPDVTFFMDIPPEIGLRRATKRGDTNKFEDKELIFHQNIYQKFKTIATMYEDRIVSLDVDKRSIQKIHNSIKNHILHLSR